MNIESKIKEMIKIFGITIEERADRICKFTNFKKEDIINAINKGGKTTSDIYKTLLNLNEK